MVYPKASIIVPTLNREQPLVDSINSALAQRYANFEVIVVDQTEKHDHVTMVALAQLAKDSRFRLIQETKKSLPHARNVGLQAATGEYIIFIDDDVALPIDFITNHLLFMKSYNAVAVGGRVVQANRPQDSIPIKFNALSRTKGDGFGGQMLREIDTFRGCNMAFHASVFKWAGIFDVNYTGSATREESDLAMRIRKRQTPILFNPLAELTHLEDDSGGCNSDNGVDRERVENAEFFKNDSLFFLKYFNKLLFPLYILGMYKAFVFKPRFIKKGVLLRQVWVVGSGVWAGLRLYIYLKTSGKLLT